MINKRLFLAGLTTGLLSLSVAFPAMAGSWKNGAGDNAARWWYDNGDNTWAANGWRWIDGNQDASANATISTPKLAPNLHHDAGRLQCKRRRRLDGKRHRSDPPDRGFQ